MFVGGGEGGGVRSGKHTVTKYPSITCKRPYNKQQPHAGVVYNLAGPEDRRDVGAEVQDNLHVGALRAPRDLVRVDVVLRMEGLDLGDKDWRRIRVGALQVEHNHLRLHRLPLPEHAFVLQER